MVVSWFCTNCGGPLSQVQQVICLFWFLNISGKEQMRNNLSTVSEVEISCHCTLAVQSYQHSVFSQESSLFSKSPMTIWPLYVFSSFPIWCKTPVIMFWQALPRTSSGALQIYADSHKASKWSTLTWLNISACQKYQWEMAQWGNHFQHSLTTRIDVKRIRGWMDILRGLILLR